MPDSATLGAPSRRVPSEVRDCRHSLIAWKLPRGDGEKLLDAIDITGRFAGVHRDYESRTTQRTSPALTPSGGLEIGRGAGPESRRRQRVPASSAATSTPCASAAPSIRMATFHYHGQGALGHSLRRCAPGSGWCFDVYGSSKEPKKGDRLCRKIYI